MEIVKNIISGSSNLTPASFSTHIINRRLPDVINDDKGQYRDPDTVDTDSDMAGPDVIDNADSHNISTNVNSCVIDTKCATNLPTEGYEIMKSVKYKEDHNCDNKMLRQQPWTEAAIVKMLKECFDSNILQVTVNNCVNMYSYFF